MKISKLFRVLILAVGLAVNIPQRAAADDDDPPGRAGRLAYAQGEVSFQPAGTDDWVSAVVNRPITTGDKLWTDRNSRVELQIGSAAIRLGSQTGFSFLNLSDDMAQIQLNEGVIGIHLQHLDRNDAVEVDTPNLAFSLLRPGDYRLEVNEAGDTTVVSVRGGEGEVTGGGQAFTIHSNQHATFTGTDQFNADVHNLGGYDDFDRWGHDRDVREERAPSARYVSRDVIGYQDLDDYGDWHTVRDYGPMWVPRSVEAGWAPYRDGHWAWISPWGWTWVDDAPWGFAPFHYGRWAFAGGRWGWCPGPIAVARPVYAPALVAWVGGPHFSIGIGIGGGVGVGWFPLAPREVYVPPYRVSRTYVNNVNVTNTTVNNTYVTNVYNNTVNNSATNIKYVNRTAPGAVTATSQTAFTSGQPVHRNMVKVDERQLAQAPVVTHAAVVPQQRSTVGGAAPARVKPPAAIQTRAVVARTAPPPAPVAFASQQKAIQSNGGQPLATQEIQRLQQSQGKTTTSVKVVKPAAKPVPIESIAKAGQPRQQPNRSMPGAPSLPNRPAQQVPRSQENLRTDRSPSAQPNKAQPPSNQREGEGQPSSTQPNKAQPSGNPSENRPQNATSPSRPDWPPSAQPNKAQPPSNRGEEERQPSSTQPNKAQSPRSPSENRPQNTSPNRPDRPPSAQPNKAQLPSNRGEEERQPSSTQPNKAQPPRNPSENRRQNASPNRPDRPPSTQPNKAQPPSNRREEERQPSSTQPNKAQPPRSPNDNRSNNVNTNRPNLPPTDNRDAELERRHQPERQTIPQNQEHQRPEQKHQQEIPRTQQPAQNQRQQQEHEKVQQNQEQQRRKMEQQRDEDNRPQR